MTNREKYMMVEDDDGHWYVIPAERLNEWDEWLETDFDDERSWTPPNFSVSIDGSRSVVFENPTI